MSTIIMGLPTCHHPQEAEAEEAAEATPTPLTITAMKTITITTDTTTTTTGAATMTRTLATTTSRGPGEDEEGGAACAAAPVRPEAAALSHQGPDWASPNEAAQEQAEVNLVCDTGGTAEARLSLVLLCSRSLLLT